MKRFVTLARPFTLLPPLLGIVSGAICAWGSAHNPDPSRALTLSVILTVTLGSACAAFLNAANNTLNQIYDLEIDRINKPGRPLVTGEVSIREAWVFTWIMYAIGVIPTWLVVAYPYTTWTEKLFAPLGRHECFFIYFVALISTFIYSVPALGRTKAHPIGANLTIAIPRGLLLKVAGWTMVAYAFASEPPFLASTEPWFIGAVFMFFLLDAASTKDFSDIAGDRAGGCRTLPIQYGVRRAAWMIAPFFIFPLVPRGEGDMNVVDQDFLDDPRPLFGEELHGFDIRDAGVVFNSARSHGFSVSRENGFTARADYENLSRGLGSDRSIQQVRADLRGYLAIPYRRSPLGRHVLAARVAGGETKGDFVLQRELRVGGTGMGEFLGLESRNFPVRGYDTGTLRGQRAALASVEYRMPIWQIDRGPGTWPLFLDRVVGDVFADAGTAWQRDGIRRTIASVGAEAGLDLFLGFAAPIRYRAGVAWLLRNPGKGSLQPYVTLETSF